MKKELMSVQTSQFGFKIKCYVDFWQLKEMLIRFLRYLLDLLFKGGLNIKVTVENISSGKKQVSF